MQKPLIKIDLSPEKVFLSFYSQIVNSINSGSTYSQEISTIKDLFYQFNSLDNAMNYIFKNVEELTGDNEHSLIELKRITRLNISEYLTNNIYSNYPYLIAQHINQINPEKGFIQEKDFLDIRKIYSAIPEDFNEYLFFTNDFSDLLGYLVNSTKKDFFDLVIVDNNCLKNIVTYFEELESRIDKPCYDFRNSIISYILD
jgi:hypothetical protein